MNKIKAVILAGVLSLITFGCITQKVRRDGETSLVAISASTNAFMAKGFGINIVLQNVENSAVYESKSLGPISPHSVIQNVAPGTYQVRKVIVPVGNVTYSSWSEDVPNYFGILVIKPNPKYYLGDFKGQRKIGFKNVLTISIEDGSIPEKLQAMIDTEASGWSGEDYVKLYPYENEELLVY